MGAVVFAGAFIGWLVGEVCGAATRALGHSFTPEDDERAFRRALAHAIDVATADVPPAARESLAAALDECFTAPPAIRDLEHDVDIGEALRLAFHAQVAPLADATATGSGRSFLDEIGVDAGRLVDALSATFVSAVRRIAASADVAGLAARLDFDELRREVRTARGGLLPMPAMSLNTLPRDVEDFVDRVDALERILERATGGTTKVVAIDGMAGVGKTAVAVHAAHLLSSRYADARLFVNLHGYSSDRDPVTPEAALESLLRSLGLQPEQIPNTLDERAGLWRSQLNDSAILVVLDNAVSSRQVLPMLPAADRSCVLVTSRRRLTGLEGVESVSLDSLSTDDAAEMFATIVGSDRSSAEIDQLRRVVVKLGCLPLALRVVAARLHHRPSWTARDLLTRLTSPDDRAAEMDVEGSDFASAFDLSYRDLRPDERRMFRRLGLHPSQDFGVHAAAALAGADLRTTRRLLGRLHDQHLVSEPRYERYELHDLLHDYAHRLATERDRPADRDAAVDRLIGFYTATANHVDSLVNLLGHRARWAERSDSQPRVRSHAEAVRWAEDEGLNLHACLRIALATGRERQALDLGSVMAYVLRLCGYWDQVLVMCEKLADLGDDLRDPESAADMRFHCGDICRLKGLTVQALQHYEQAGSLYDHAGDRYRSARVQHSIGDLHRSDERYSAALARYQAALTVYREVGRSLAETRARHSIADTHRLSGSHSQALDYYDQLLTSYQALEDRVGEARIWFGIGDVHRLVGNPHDAVTHAGKALASFRELGDRLGEADALLSLAGSLHLLGQNADAVRCYEEAESIYQGLNDHDGQARARQGLDLLNRELGPEAPR